MLRDKPILTEEQVNDRRSRVVLIIVVVFVFFALFGTYMYPELFHVRK